MNVMSVRIHKKGDPPVYPSGELLFHKQGGLEAVVLEGGTTSGRPSVAFVASDERGAVVLETSARQILTLAAIIKTRFPELQEVDL